MGNFSINRPPIWGKKKINSKLEVSTLKRERLFKIRLSLPIKKSLQNQNLLIYEKKRYLKIPSEENKHTKHALDPEYQPFKLKIDTFNLETE